MFFWRAVIHWWLWVRHWHCQTAQLEQWDISVSVYTAWIHKLLRLSHAQIKQVLAIATSCWSLSSRYYSMKVLDTRADGWVNMFYEQDSEYGRWLELLTICIHAYRAMTFCWSEQGLFLSQGHPVPWSRQLSLTFRCHLTFLTVVCNEMLEDEIKEE